MKKFLLLLLYTLFGESCWKSTFFRTMSIELRDISMEPRGISRSSGEL